VEPTAKKPTENRCDVSYAVAAWFFEIRGKNFPDAKLLADGGGLKKEMDGCGDVSLWNFEWTRNHEEYQWYASGYLPLTAKKGCTGRAVVSAGGVSENGC
jgi:hypothetical protein